MKQKILMGVIALGIAGGTYVLTRPDTPTPPPGASARAATDGAPIVSVTLPESLSPEARIGKTAFNATCADCHGDNGAGRDGYGPPLIHKVYEPSHHGDMAFQLAVQRGVRAHHWSFGDMPPQEGLTEGDVKAITSYVREVQRANGIQ